MKFYFDKTNKKRTKFFSFGFSVLHEAPLEMENSEKSFCLEMKRRNVSIVDTVDCVLMELIKAIKTIFKTPSASLQCNLLDYSIRIQFARRFTADIISQSTNSLKYEFYSSREMKE